MGSGSFHGSKFHLYVTLNYEASESVLALWRVAFEFASRVLFDATDGQMQIGTVTWGNNNAGVSHADLRLYASTTQTSGNSGNIGDTGSFCRLYHDETLRPFVIAHELGHYALYLGDEYWHVTRGNWDQCASNGHAESASIMGFAWSDGLQLNPDGTINSTGFISEFCCETNHATSIGSIQQQTHGESCWNTIARKYPGIVAPLPGDRPVGPPPTPGPDPLIWEELEALTSLYVVTDLPASAPQLKTAAAKVFELAGTLSSVQLSGTDLGSPAPKPGEQPESPVIDSTLSEIAAFFRSSMPASRQSVVWISDGFSAEADGIRTVATSFANRRIDFHGLAGDVNPDISTMDAFSTITRGSLRTAGISSISTDAVEFTTELLLSVFESIEHYSFAERRGFLLTNDHDLNRPLDSSTEIVRHGQSTSGGTVIELPVLVEDGAESVVFVCVSDIDSETQFQLRAPDGHILDADGGKDAVRFRSADGDLRAFEILAPEPGSWTLLVVAPNRESTESIELVAATRNPKLTLSWKISPQTKRQRRVSLITCWDQPLISLEPAYLNIERRTDNGLWEPVRVAPIRPSHEEQEWLTRQVEFEKPGIYRLRTRISNIGNARQIVATPPKSEFPSPTTPGVVPNFGRVTDRVLSIE